MHFSGPAFPPPGQRVFDMVAFRARINEGGGGNGGDGAIGGAGGAGGNGLGGGDVGGANTPNAWTSIRWRQPDCFFTTVTYRPE